MFETLRSNETKKMLLIGEVLFLIRTNILDNGLAETKNILLPQEQISQKLSKIPNYPLFPYKSAQLLLN